MTNKQAMEVLWKMIDEHIRKSDEIMEEAQKNGTWKMGLDSNRELFVELDREYKGKFKAALEQLKLMIDKD